MDIPITFKSSENIDAQRIIHASIQTANGFYCSRGFAVLPYLNEKNPSSVYLPKLKYDRIPDYWNTIRIIEENVPLSAPDEFLEQVENIIPKATDQINTDEFLMYWKDISVQFWKFMDTVLPCYKKHIKCIEVRLTNYGSKMSYSPPNLIHNGTFTCYLRKDFAVSQIGEGIISSMLRTQQDKIGNTWESIETISDFLIHRLIDMGVFREYFPTIYSLENQSISLINESKKYMHTLGLHFDKCFKVDRENIYCNNKNITSRLTETQRKLLFEFILHENEIVEYDNLGRILWDEDEQYSLWAINKQVQRLRQTLGEFGISPQSLKSVHAKGYSLIN